MKRRLAAALALIAWFLIAPMVCPALAAHIPCSGLETAGTDELLAAVVVDTKLIRYGGDVRVEKSDCEESAGRKVCNWETWPDDDRMLDPDHRLIGVISSHLTGSGSWWDILVFACVAGEVGTVYQGQFGRWDSSGFDSAPPALRPLLEDYVKEFKQEPTQGAPN